MTAGGIRSSLRHHLRPYLAREAVLLALLAVVAVVCFGAVTELSNLYRGQQESLGNRWFSRGVKDLEAQRFEAAVVEFRAALVYSRDDFSYQLNLAQALLGTKQPGEAYAYLINLWDREPENGLVNLELARIAAQRRQTDQALRYYHNAIYATWPDNPSGDAEVERRNARLELIRFLLSINAKAQAQAELIALAANSGDDPSLQEQLGDLFARAQDYEHALAAYRESLKSDRHNASALAGAGLAAFELNNYAVAERYLQAAVSATPSDAPSTDRLKITELVLQLDPFRAEISAAQRYRAVIEDFATAGERLKACAAASGPSTPSASQTSLSDSWTKMKPKVTALGLRRDPDLVAAAMDVVFDIERQTSATCGVPAGTDMALLLIAKLHEGN